MAAVVELFLVAVELFLVAVELSLQVAPLELVLLEEDDRLVGLHSRIPNLLALFDFFVY